MVSSLYRADAFYKKQNKKKIATPYDSKQKLKKDKDGLYLWRKTSKGDMYKQRVKSDDYVYTRAETGVTKYSPSRDSEIKGVSRLKEPKKVWQKHAHKGDRARKDGTFYKTYR